MAERDDTLLNLLADNRLSVNDFEQAAGVRPVVPLKQAFMTVGRAFKAIDAPTKGVIVPYGAGGATLIADLCASPTPEREGRLLQQAQQYSVNVFPNVFENLMRVGALLEIGNGAGIFHVLPAYYNDDFGLSEQPANTLEDLHA